MVWNLDLASTRSNDHGNHEELDVVQKQVGGFMRKLEVVHMEVGGRLKSNLNLKSKYDSIATVGEIRVYQRADFQSGSRVLKKVF